jgi:hypothetical protein
MAKKIIDTGKTARRIEVTDRPARRIEPEAFAAALGAEPVGEGHSPNLDPLSLAALGNDLIKRLRSSGGRPALADATEICRVPLSAEDVKALEGIVAHLEASSGAKPSVGQVVSVIVRRHLTTVTESHDHGQIHRRKYPERTSIQTSSWLDAWNGKRQKCLEAQTIIQQAGTTWGRKRVA